MSYHQNTENCPVCGGENMDCFSDNRPFEDVGGDCLDCGFYYHTVIDMRTLEEVNEMREENDLPPLDKLAEPKPDGMEPPPRQIHPPFNPEELTTLLEAARLCLNEKGQFHLVAETTDLSDEALGDLADRLDKYMRPELYV